MTLSMNTINDPIKKLISYIINLITYIYMFTIVRKLIWIYNSWCFFTLLFHLSSPDKLFYISKFIIVFGLTVALLGIIIKNKKF